jgi:carotene epsilon-monooxygenase
MQLLNAARCAPCAPPQVPLLCQLVPRQRKALDAVALIRRTTEDLIKQCKEMVDEEEMAAASQAEDYMNEADPSVLRWAGCWGWGWGLG